MKNLSIYSIFAALLIIFAFNACKKSPSLPSCSAERQVFRTLVDQKGTVFYYESYNKFAVSIDTLILNNLDTHINGLPCELPKEFQIEGARVTLNGRLEKFNDGENFVETVGGEQLYFLRIDKITAP